VVERPEEAALLDRAAGVDAELLVGERLLGTRRRRGRARRGVEPVERELRVELARVRGREEEDQYRSRVPSTWSAGTPMPGPATAYRWQPSHAARPGWYGSSGAAGGVPWQASQASRVGSVHTGAGVV